MRLGTGRRPGYKIEPYPTISRENFIYFISDVPGNRRKPGASQKKTYHLVHSGWFLERFLGVLGQCVIRKPARSVLGPLFYARDTFYMYSCMDAGEL
jgi:hypothetical protein